MNQLANHKSLLAALLSVSFERLVSEVGRIAPRPSEYLGRNPTDYPVKKYKKPLLCVFSAIYMHPKLTLGLTEV